MRKGRQPTPKSRRCALDRVWELVTDINLLARLERVCGATWIDGPAMGARFAGRNWHKAMGEWETVSIVNRFEPMREFGWCVTDVDEPSSTWWFELSSSLMVCASVNERAWVRRHQD